MGDNAGKRRGDSELIRVNYCYGDFNFKKIVGLNTARNTWRLIADNNMPSVILLRDGHVQQIWDEKIPDKDGIKEALS
jgi:hypothetical protein